MRKLLPFVILFNIFTPNVLASACNGYLKPKPKEVFKSSDAIFIGQVKDIIYIDSLYWKNQDKRIIVTFEVEKFWKGNLEKTIMLHTVLNTAYTIGYYFEVNKKYIVYAKKYTAREWMIDLSELKISPDSMVFGTLHCGGTKLLSSGEKDLKALNKRDTRNNNLKF